jgi:hypothetical protein
MSNYEELVEAAKNYKNPRVEAAKKKIRYHAGGGAVDMFYLLEEIVPITRNDVFQAMEELIRTDEFYIRNDTMFCDVRAKEELDEMDGIDG